MNPLLKDYNAAPPGLAYQVNDGNGVRIVKPHAILPNHKAKLLEDIRHLQTQLGRLSEAANKIYAEVVHLTVED